MLEQILTGAWMALLDVLSRLGLLVLKILVLAVVALALIMITNSVIHILHSRRKDAKPRIEDAVDGHLQAGHFKKALELAKVHGDPLLIRGVKARLKEEKDSLVSQIYYERWESKADFLRLLSRVVELFTLLDVHPQEWNTLAKWVIDSEFRKAEEYLAKRMPPGVWQRRLSPPRRSWWRRWRGKKG